MTRARRIQELVTFLGNLALHTFFTRDDLVRLLQAQVVDADSRDCQEAICRVVTLGVFGHIGSNYLRRRDVTSMDLQQIVGAAPVDPPTTRAAILSSQVQAFRAAVAQGRHVHPWLHLDLDRSPLDFREALMERATQDLGPGVSHADLMQHAHRIAAQRLLQAFGSRE